MFLTSLTTCLGLTPLLLEQSVQAQFLIPMAVSIASGVAAATTICLVVVPAGYLALDDIGRWVTGRSEAAAASASDAAASRPQIREPRTPLAPATR